jgi:hypothetical protein
MALETATFIEDLDPANPTGSDLKSQGDNHFRLIKDVLQNQFPSLGATAVTVTAAQLNTIPTLAVSPSMVDISNVSASITWNGAVANSISKITLDGNKNFVYGTFVVGWHTLIITQMTPAKTATWDASYKHFGVGSGFTPDLGTAAGHKTVVSGFYDGAEFMVGNSPKHY